MPDMTADWRQFTNLAALISPYSKGHVEGGDFDWHQMIAIANDHWITPAMFGPARNRGDVPTEISDYLEGMHTLNRYRNEAHLGAIEDIVDRLAKAGIQPVWLKGAAALLTGLYEDPASRIIGDLDFLVTPEHLSTCRHIISDMGYGLFPGKEKQASSHHLPRMFHASTGVTLELHFKVIPAVSAQVLRTNEAYSSRQKHQWRERTVYTLSEQNRIIHNIIHQQAGGSRQNLRQLREFATLMKRHGNVVNWSDICAEFGKHKFLNGFIDHVTASHHLMNSPTQLPAQFHSTAESRYEANIETRFDFLMPDDVLGRFMLHVKTHGRDLLTNPSLIARLWQSETWHTSIPKVIKRIWSRPTRNKHKSS